MAEVLFLVVPSCLQQVCDYTHVKLLSFEANPEGYAQFIQCIHSFQSSRTELI